MCYTIVEKIEWLAEAFIGHRKASLFMYDRRARLQHIEPFQIDIPLLFLGVSWTSYWVVVSHMLRKFVFPLVER